MFTTRVAVLGVFLVSCSSQSRGDLTVDSAALVAPGPGTVATDSTALDTISAASPIVDPTPPVVRPDSDTVRRQPPSRDR